MTQSAMERAQQEALDKSIKRQNEINAEELKRHVDRVIWTWRKEARVDARQGVMRNPLWLEKYRSDPDDAFAELVEISDRLERIAEEVVRRMFAEDEKERR